MTNTVDAIHANIALLEQRLHCALALVVEARQAASRHEQNLAIGTLLPAEQDIGDAASLQRAVVMLRK